jgi:hypothetical protein
MAAVAVGVLLHTGCRAGTPPVAVPTDAPASPAPPASPGEWVAVFAVGSPDDLEDESARIQDRAPANIAVSPVSCWEGLLAALDAETDAYVAAVTAGSPEELEEAVARVGLEVTFRGQLLGRCTD